MLGIQKYKVGLLCARRSLVMGETKVSTNSDQYKDGDGRSLGRPPGAKQTVGPALLFRHLDAPSLGEKYNIVLDIGSRGLIPEDGEQKGLE